MLSDSSHTLFTLTQTCIAKQNSFVRKEKERTGHANTAKHYAYTLRVDTTQFLQQNEHA